MKNPFQQHIEDLVKGFEFSYILIEDIEENNKFINDENEIEYILYMNRFFREDDDSVGETNLDGEYDFYYTPIYPKRKLGLPANVSREKLIGLLKKSNDKQVMEVFKELKRWRAKEANLPKSKKLKSLVGYLEDVILLFTHWYDQNNLNFPIQEDKLGLEIPKVGKPKGEYGAVKKRIIELLEEKGLTDTGDTIPQATVELFYRILKKEGITKSKTSNTIRKILNRLYYFDVYSPAHHKARETDATSPLYRATKKTGGYRG